MHRGSSGDSGDEAPSVSYSETVLAATSRGIPCPRSVGDSGSPQIVSYQTLLNHDPSSIDAEPVTISLASEADAVCAHWSWTARRPGQPLQYQHRASPPLRTERTGRHGEGRVRHPACRRARRVRLRPSGLSTSPRSAISTQSCSPSSSGTLAPAPPPAEEYHRLLKEAVVASAMIIDAIQGNYAPRVGRVAHSGAARTRSGARTYRRANSPESSASVPSDQTTFVTPSPIMATPRARNATRGSA